jgi:hypothetical protein
MTAMMLWLPVSSGSLWCPGAKETARYLPRTDIVTAAIMSAKVQLP